MGVAVLGAAQIALEVIAVVARGGIVEVGYGVGEVVFGQIELLAVGAEAAVVLGLRLMAYHEADAVFAAEGLLVVEALRGVHHAGACGLLFAVAV